MVLAWSVFEEMPSSPLSLPPTSKANMFCCGVGFFRHPVQHKLSGTAGSFSLSFVSPETDLFKWYAGSTLLLQALVLVVFWTLVQFPWKLWKMGLSPARSPLKLIFSCIFPKRFPFSVFWEEQRWVRPIYFHVIERRGSCLNARLLPGESTWSPGWVSTWLLLLPSVGPLR